MKKFIYIFAVCLGVFFLGSCEKENFDFLDHDSVNCGEEVETEDRGRFDDPNGGGIADPNDDDDDNDDDDSDITDPNDDDDDDEDDDNQQVEERDL